MKIRLKPNTRFIHPNNYAEYKKFQDYGQFWKAGLLVQEIGCVVSDVKRIIYEGCGIAMKPKFYVIDYASCELKVPLSECEVISEPSAEKS